jgi:hypothetical protein
LLDIILKRATTIQDNMLSQTLTYETKNLVCISE